MKAMNEREWMEQLRKEGFQEVQISPNAPNTEFAEHTHDQFTVHIVVHGELLLEEEDGEKIIKEGERYEIPAGTTHRAKAGPNGCTFIVGFKPAAK